MLKISKQSANPTVATEVINELGRKYEVEVSQERALIIKIDGVELVTLMTLGVQPEALVLGYLKNQRLIKKTSELKSIKVDWDTETALVVSKNGIKNLQEKTKNRIITTGCGQGTVFSCTMDEVYNANLSPPKIHQSTVYSLLKNLSNYNKVYKSAGAVHSCALCRSDEVLIAVEDVGRHNAADIIAGLMLLDGLDKTTDLIFYTTGRITSEIVMKIAQMGIAVVLSRSGVTKMGLEIAQDVGIMIIARAKAKHFLLFSNSENMVFDLK